MPALGLCSCSLAGVPWPRHVINQSINQSKRKTSHAAATSQHVTNV
jgi:hypothetical protein